MLDGHLSQQHPTELRPYLGRMRTEGIGTAVAQAFEAIQEDSGPYVGSYATFLMSACWKF
jgi:hypothetical protein